MLMPPAGVRLRDFHAPGPSSAAGGGRRALHIVRRQVLAAHSVSVIWVCAAGANVTILAETGTIAVNYNARLVIAIGKGSVRLKVEPLLSSDVCY